MLGFHTLGSTKVADACACVHTRVPGAQVNKLIANLPKPDLPIESHRASSSQLEPIPVPNPVPIPVPNWVLSSSQLNFFEKQQILYLNNLFLQKFNWELEKTQLGTGMGTGLGTGMGSNWELDAASDCL